MSRRWKWGATFFAWCVLSFAIGHYHGGALDAVPPARFFPVVAFVVGVVVLGRAAFRAWKAWAQRPRW